MLFIAKSETPPPKQRDHMCAKEKLAVFFSAMSFLFVCTLFLL